MATEVTRTTKKLPSLGTLITVGSAILAFLKIHSFAHWDTYTVLTILTHQSFAGLFAITLVVLLPAALLVTFWMLATSLGESIREESRAGQQRSCVRDSVLDAFSLPPGRGRSSFYS